MDLSELELLKAVGIIVTDTVGMSTTAGELTKIMIPSLVSEVKMLTLSPEMHWPSRSKRYVNSALPMAQRPLGCVRDSSQVTDTMQPPGAPYIFQSGMHLD